MKIDQRKAWIYLLIHAAAIGGLFLFPLYKKISDLIPNFLSGCFLHDRLFLYCPLCGGTRALEALLHLDLLTAFRYNALVVILAFIVLILDIWGLIRLLSGKNVLIPLKGWCWVALSVLVVIYAFLRNYLMIVHGYDPVGDLLEIRKFFNL